ncbi:ABC transporter ATP-binding protein [Streptomyces sp. NRRL S-920]|uniref:ABC transporter ATP-binding protein n=1 Tax=Streptomyces sp. NRRL S-920 TaxID=1463921 RepID=UPI002D21C336|nr:ABC transporter ATP-binding protein [Streptomyces sp. NRRL S-920]
MVLKVSGLRYRVGNREVLKSVDLVVRSGQSVSISGPSGCGKSTLLMCCLGLVKPDAGGVVVCGQRMDQLSGRRLLRHRRESVGMVFQAGELLPELAPLENVAIAGLLASMSRAEAFARAEELLAELAVPTKGADTGSLSGGERQRVAVARALVNRPSLILADEPTGALDSAARETVADLLYALPERWQCGLVVVTHDPDVAARAQRRLLLTDGCLIPARTFEPAGTGASS